MSFSRRGLAVNLARAGMAVAVATPLTLAGLTASADATPAPTTYDHYVALGDSYTASTGFGVQGIDTTFVPLSCAQSNADYPHQVAALLRSQGALDGFTDASCGGATTDNFTGPQSSYGMTNAPQFDRITPETDLVTIGIGGNDIGLVGLASECLASTLQSCKAKHVRNGVDDVSQTIAATQPKIEAAIAGVRARAAKDVRIVLVNYLEAMPDNEKGCYPLVPVTPTDAAWFTQKYKEMNRMLASAAAAQKVEIVDTYTPTIGHSACALPTVRYVEPVGVVTLNPIGTVSAPLHPNQAGANAQSQLVFAHLQQD